MRPIMAAVTVIIFGRRRFTAPWTIASCRSAIDRSRPFALASPICYRIEIAPELKHTRVILFAARPRDVDISIGLRGFADASLEKPSDPVLLLATIGKLQSGESGTPAKD
jgi:hypothetical protein